MSQKKMCGGCPFDYCSEESARFQNYGCLPSPIDIIKEMNETNKNWACHDNPKKICKGLLNHVEELNEPINIHIAKLRKEDGSFIGKIDFSRELLLQEGVHY